MNYLSILTIASIMTIGLQAQIYDVYPCTRNRIFPPSSDIPANPIFLIQTIYDDEIILNLNKKYPVYLKSRQEKIRLIIKEIHKGEQGKVIQALLSPITLLEVGREYELIIDSLTSKQKNYLFASDVGPAMSPIYNVIKGLDTVPPVVTRKPNLMYKLNLIRSCTQVVGAVFCLNICDTSGFIIKTILKHKKRGIETICYFNQNDMLFVGKGTYISSFLPMAGERLKVKFLLMDASGNISRKNYKPIKFRIPRKHTTIREQNLFNKKQCKKCL